MTTIFAVVATLAQATWILCCWVLLISKDLKRQRPPLARAIWAELRPFYLPATAVTIAADFANGRIWGWFWMLSHASWILNWFLFKDIDDDDRWKEARPQTAREGQRHRPRAGRRARPGRCPMIDLPLFADAPGAEPACREPEANPEWWFAGADTWQHQEAIRTCRRCPLRWTWRWCGCRERCGVA
jgi:hypothetical protein